MKTVNFEGQWSECWKERLHMRYFSQSIILQKKCQYPEHAWRNSVQMKPTNWLNADRHISGRTQLLISKTFFFLMRMAAICEFGDFAHFYKVVYSCVSIFTKRFWSLLLTVHAHHQAEIFWKPPWKLLKRRLKRIPLSNNRPRSNFEILAMRLHGLSSRSSGSMRKYGLRLLASRF